jgi:hypothetical protein
MEPFFTQTLGVPKPTTRMYMESLKAEANANAPPSRLKEIMVLINSLGAKFADVVGLQEAKVFPIKLTNGTSSLASASFNFAILDNNAHWDTFQGKIAALDFSLEEVRDTRQFLLAIGLEDRFSSKLVKEVTDVKGGSFDQEMTDTLRLKSEAIVR